MSSAKPNEASIFNTARKIESTIDRDDYLTESCQGDAVLRDRIEKLLIAFAAESRFLEQPAAGLEATIHLDPSIQNRGSALQAGLAAAFTADEAVLLGKGNHSVLKMLGQTLPSVPRVALRESNGEGADPIMRPKSPEMPNRNSDNRFQLQGEIARGGMGAILKGRDTDLGRDLAIKVLLDTHKNKPEVVQRFIEEAQIGGQLQHPGIAPIYELGQFADKRPFFAMKLIKGKTLSVLLAERQELAADRAKFVGIFEQVCQTMAYVHSRGVIHRDLKPANIMVGAFGEVQVMDWGLAKVLKSGGTEDEKRSHQAQQGQSIVQTLRSVGSDVPGPFGSGGSGGSETQLGSVMGTPAYMPPEQALGEIDRLDERSDVFGLGAILSEILTGKPPYSASDSTEIFRLASRGKLADCFTRLDVCGADEELIKLAKHCLELEPNDRPRDAGVLIEKVSNYIESVEARLHKSDLERAAQTARAIEERKLRRMTLVSAAGAILMISLGCGGWMWREFEQAERRAVITAKVNNAMNEAMLHRSLADAPDASMSTHELADVATLESRLIELERAVEAAKRAADHSEELDINVELKDNATSLLAKLNEQTAIVAKLAEQTRRDRALQKELEEIRLSQLDGDNSNDRYRQIFRDTGLDLTNLDKEEAATRIRESMIQESILSAIDNWIRLIRTPTPSETYDTTIELRNREVAANVGQETLLKLRLREITNEVDRNPWRMSLRTAMDARDSSGLRLLASADQVHDERVELIALIGSALRGCGEIELSISLLHKAQQRHPGDLWLNSELCLSMGRKGKKLESLGFARAALALRPNSPGAHNILGAALAGAGQLNEAIVEFRKAIELGGKYADAHINLGNTLRDNNQNDEAIAEFRRAIELNPKHAVAHFNLGNALSSKGQNAESIAEYRIAIELDPKFASPRINLGADLHQKGLVDEAIIEYRKAIAEYRKGFSDDVDFAMAHNNLGYALRSKGLLEEAIAEYRKAIELDSKHSRAQRGLNAALSASNLPAFIKGEFKPRDNSERIGLAAACYDMKLYHSAVGLYNSAFESDAKLTDDRQNQHIYSAACNAVLATTAQCKDSIQLDDSDHARLRRHAFDWLKAEIELWGKLLDSDPTQALLIVDTLRHWQIDTDLENIRDTQALDKLPADEKAAFEQLWSNVDKLIKRAGSQSK